MSDAKFEIGIVDARPNSDGHTNGFIRIGEFHERFVVTLNYWTTQDYEKHWRAALQRLIGGADSVGMMTWIIPPGSDDNARAWILYRHGDLVYIQERLFPWSGVRPQFDADGQLINIEQRQTHNDEGDAISEWCIPLTAVLSFLRNS